MNIKKGFFWVIILLNFIRCSPEKGAPQSSLEEINNRFTTRLEYAKNVEITEENEATRVRVIEPFKGAQQSLEYLFVPKDSELPANVNGATVIRTPVTTMVCTSTTYLPYLEMLNSADRLVGFPSTKYISSNMLVERVQSGKIVDLGRDSNINIELLLDLDPEVVLTYTVAGLSSNDNQINKSGIPVVIGAGYLEEEPLGRAEWIKFMALFLGKEKEADSIFNVIKKNYEEVVAAVDSVKDKPTVFTSTVYKDVWYMPGGNSWAGKYFNTAKADYIWKDQPESGSMELSFESVYDEAFNADFWIGTDGYSSFSSLIQADVRYQNFDAFKNKQVYSYNKRISPSGANDYFESGIARPDLVLKDIVKILHPHLLPDHDLYFYEKLKK